MDINKEYNSVKDYLSDVLPLVLFLYTLYFILVVCHKLDCRLEMQVSVSFQRGRNDR